MTSGVRGVRPGGEGAPRVTLYTRTGCHLCEVARALLLALQRTIPFHLEAVDIEGDADLERRFLLEIPVVEIEGEVVASGNVEVEALRGALNRARIASTRRHATGGGEG